MIQSIFILFEYLSFQFSPFFSDDEIASKKSSFINNSRSSMNLTILSRSPRFYKSARMSEYPGSSVFSNYC